jgi:hypothetical protein
MTAFIPTCWEKMQRTSMEGIVSNQTQQQVRRSEAERADWKASHNTKLSFRSDAIARDHCQRIDPIKITRNIIDRIQM